MMRIVKLTQKERENILENLLKRSPINIVNLRQRFAIFWIK